MKKNNSIGWGCKFPGIKKLLQIMKLTLMLVVISVIGAFASKSYSQTKNLSLKLERATVKEVLSDIEKQSEFYFMYSEKIIDVNREVNINIKNQKIESVLKELFAGTEINYTIRDRIIVLTTPEVFNDNPNSSFQQNVVSGKVTDSSGLPLPGVTVVVKGTTQGTVTNADGNYTLSNISENATLIFSFVGMKTQEFATDGKTTIINVTMAEEAVGIEEVVAIGYGDRKKSSVTGAITKMEAEDVEDIPVPNLSNALAGRMSGVFVDQKSGAPGYAADIRIRSVNTWKSTGNEPLYVIDGVILDKSSFDALDFSEVENITVLKDAASGSIYGARAANGVILITTKTGQKGKFKLNYSYSYSFDQPSKIPDYTDAYETALLNQHAYGLQGIEFMDEEELAYYKENDPAKAYYDLAYSDPTLQKHSLTGTGGTERFKYFVGASYFNQTGFIKTAEYKKFNIRSNVDINFTDELSCTFKISYNEGINERFAYREDMDYSTFDSRSDFGNLWGRLLYYLPFTKPVTSEGLYVNTGWIGNPLAFINEGGTNTAKDQNTDFLIGLNYDVPFVDGLSISGKFSRNYTIESTKQYEIKPTLYDVAKEGSHEFIYTDEVIGSSKGSWPPTERLGQRQVTNTNYQLNFGVNYVKKFGEHNIDFLFNYEQSEGVDNTFYGVRENFTLLYTDQFWATGSSRDASYLDGSEYEYGRASFISRLSYHYGDKYFLDATLRRDGSMLFAPDYRWGYFPSVSLGWILTNENFLKEGFLNFLKLRASWGSTGNDAVGGWEWIESYASNGSVMIGESMVPRVTYSGIINEKLTWEKTNEINIGLDSHFLGGVIFNMEYYYRHNYDILDSRIASLPASFGGSMPPVNYGIVDGNGIEFEIGYTGNIREFKYELKGNLSYVTNKVIKKDTPENVRDVNNPNGRSTDMVAMLVSTGILRTQEDIDALPEGYTIYGITPELGMLNYEDVSGLELGIPDGKIDDYDRQVIEGKHYIAPYTYGLNLAGSWKDFGIDIFFQGVSGISKLYSNAETGRAFHGGARAPSFRLDSWTPDNIDAEYPQVSLNSQDHQASTFWLRSGDFIRLKQLNFYYSLPKSIIQKVNLTDVRLQLMGTNLFTITPWDYYDPSVEAAWRYPTMKTYTLGINVTF